MMRSIITGTGRSVPAWVVTNDDLSERMDTAADWIRPRTGIEKRQWIEPGERGVAMARAAALAALGMAGLAPGDLDAIIYATSTPDQFIPGNGVYLQRELCIAATIPAIDIRMQCAGFVYALSVADAYIRTGAFGRILVVGQEIQSTRLEVSTAGRDTSVIFADGAGAVVLETAPEDGRGILAFDLHGEGQNAEKLWVEGPGSLCPPSEWPKHLAEGRFWLRSEEHTSDLQSRFGI